MRITTNRSVDDIDLDQLADELIDAAGQALSVTLEPLPDGGTAVVILPPVPDVPLTLAQNKADQVIRGHARKPAPGDPVDSLLSALQGATTVAQLRAALLAWAALEKAHRGRGRPSSR